MTSIRMAVVMRVSQQRKADGLAGGFHGGVFALEGGAHDGETHAGHDGLDIGKVVVDGSGGVDNVADAFDGLARLVGGSNALRTSRRDQAPSRRSLGTATTRRPAEAICAFLGDGPRAAGLRT